MLALSVSTVATRFKYADSECSHYGEPIPGLDGLILMSNVLVGHCGPQNTSGIPAFDIIGCASHCLCQAILRALLGLTRSSREGTFGNVRGLGEGSPSKLSAPDHSGFFGFML